MGRKVGPRKTESSIGRHSHDPAGLEKQPSPPEGPEELSLVWDHPVADAFGGLLPKQQQFLIEYLRSWNGAEAYRRAYNPLAKIEVACANSSRLIANAKVSAILEQFSSRRTEALLLVARTYFEMAQATKPSWVEDSHGQYENAGDAPDWKTRKDGADGLAKLYGLYAPDKVNHAHEVRNEIVRYYQPIREEPE